MEENEEKMRKNILYSYLVIVLRSALLMIAILVPFFNEYGMTQFQVGVLQAFFFVVIMLLEAPSGYAADRFGRKNTMLVGAWLGLAGMTLYTIAEGFAGFMIVEALLGAGLAMFSGADDSLVYDSLLELGEKDRYLEYQSRSRMYGAYSEMIAAIIGGSWLALYGLKFPFYAQVLIEIALIYCVMQLTEPPREKIQSKGAVKDIKHIARYCLEKPKLKWLIAYFAIATNVTHTVVWIIQPIYKEAELNLALFGYVWAGGMLFSALSSRFSAKAQDIAGRNLALIGCLALSVAAYFVLGWKISLATLPVLYLFNFARGVSSPILSNFINEQTDSSIRASVNSIASFIKAVVYIPAVSAVGYMADVYSLKFALLTSGVFYGIASLTVCSFAVYNFHKPD